MPLFAPHEIRHLVGDRTEADPRIPIALLTGFLGSGKTTVLNHLVQQPELRETLVLINEFGEIGLDHLLVAPGRDDVVIEMSSGCLCCTIRGDLADTLRDALWRFARGGRTWFNRVVIETTGLADPAPILHTLSRLSDRIRRSAAGRAVGVPGTVLGNGRAETDSLSGSCSRSCRLRHIPCWRGSSNRRGRDRGHRQRLATLALFQILPIVGNSPEIPSKSLRQPGLFQNRISQRCGSQRTRHGEGSPIDRAVPDFMTPFTGAHKPTSSPLQMLYDVPVH